MPRIAQDEIAHARSSLGADVGGDRAARDRRRHRAEGAFSNASRAAGLITVATRLLRPYARRGFLSARSSRTSREAYNGRTLITNKAYLTLGGHSRSRSLHRASFAPCSTPCGLHAVAAYGARERSRTAREASTGPTALDHGYRLDQGARGPTSCRSTQWHRFSGDGQVLNIVYSKAAVTMGGFFPAGVTFLKTRNNA